MKNEWQTYEEHDLMKVAPAPKQQFVLQNRP